MISKRALFATILGLSLLVITSGIVIYRNKSFIPFFKANEPSQSVVPNEVIAKVGQEELFLSDLNYELSQAPEGNSEKMKQILLDKMITDSVVLQGAGADKILTLDPTFYNSSNKDYLKRIQQVQSVKDFIVNSNDTLEGSVVSLWYHNNSWVGPLGLAKSKEIALAKITELHAAVSSGKMTIEEAGVSIKSDTSLVQIDRAYENNAIFAFKSLRSEAKPITLSRELDSELWNLAAGGVSKVYSGKAVDLIDTSKTYDALYMFGKVARRTLKGSQNMSYDQWVQSKRAKYPVIK